jgi:steroid 5-alpha reductase family enzyme
MDIISRWLLFWCVAMMFVYMTLAFLLAKKRKRLDTVDGAWGIGFVIMATLTAGLYWQPRTILVLILVDIWAIRITNHLVGRLQKSKTDDKRYIELAKKWPAKEYWQRAYTSVFLLQGFLVLVIGAPIMFTANPPLRNWAVWATVGAVVWVIGFCIEFTADRQLRTFITQSSNKNKVLKTGLWRYSRHPNYLGEITSWYGIGIIACGTCYGWIGLIGPTVLALLIRFISGVPPIENRKKHEPEYAEYMKNTGAILPKFRFNK